jgi:hypothetical protein
MRKEEDNVSKLLLVSFFSFENLSYSKSQKKDEKMNRDPDEVLPALLPPPRFE